MLTFAPFKRTNDCFTDFKKAKKMKKLVFMFVAIAAISFASCGNKTAQNTASADSDTAQVDTLLLLIQLLLILLSNLKLLANEK